LRKSESYDDDDSKEDEEKETTMTQDRDKQQHDDKAEKEMVKVVQELEATERAIQEEFGDFVDEPDSHQKKILVELGRLQLSLLGPEGLLDKGNYSRPIPASSSAAHQPRVRKTKGER
jgi:hypothetical protein